MLSKKEFKKLNPDKISKALFDGIVEIRNVLDNHISKHESYQKDLEKIIKETLQNVAVRFVMSE